VLATARASAGRSCPWPGRARLRLRDRRRHRLSRGQAGRRSPALLAAGVV